jgi:hypothetical protein
MVEKDNRVLLQEFPLLWRQRWGSPFEDARDFLLAPAPFLARYQIVE